MITGEQCVRGVWTWYWNQIIKSPNPKLCQLSTHFTIAVEDLDGFVFLEIVTWTWGAPLSSSDHTIIGQQITEFFFIDAKACMAWSHCYPPPICPPWLIAPCCSCVYTCTWIKMVQDVHCKNICFWNQICSYIYIYDKDSTTMHPGPVPCWAPSAISNHPGESIELRLSAWHGPARCNVIRPQLGTNGENKKYMTDCCFFIPLQDQFVFKWMFCEFIWAPMWVHTNIL